ncbi:MAG: hypothetical protein ACRCWM_11535 [Sarcina sp.]
MKRRSIVLLICVISCINVKGCGVVSLDNGEETKVECETDVEEEKTFREIEGIKLDYVLIKKSQEDE